MLSRIAVRDTVERVLDLKPVRKATSGVARVRRAKWRNKFQEDRMWRRALGACLNRKIWLREPGHYSGLLLGREDQIVREQVRSAGLTKSDLSAFNEDVDPERKRALFYGVMAGLREYYYPWSEFTGRDIPYRDIFEAAGVIVRPFDDRQAKMDAVSSWHPVPTIEIHPELLEKGWYQEALLHELHHLTSPHGNGKHREDEGHVNEVLAGRFANSKTTLNRVREGVFASRFFPLATPCSVSPRAMMTGSALSSGPLWTGRLGIASRQS